MNGMCVCKNNKNSKLGYKLTRKLASDKKPVYIRVPAKITPIRMGVKMPMLDRSEIYPILQV